MQIGILKNTARVELYQDLLVQLKVPVMANVLGKLANDPAHQNMTLVEAVATMASQELESRAQKRHTALRSARTVRLEPGGCDQCHPYQGTQPEGTGSSPTHDL